MGESFHLSRTVKMYKFSARRRQFDLAGNSVGAIRLLSSPKGGARQPASFL
jgi:hypothetical protein